MAILNPFKFQKSIQYNTLIEDEIYFSESISSVIRKIGKPNNIENSDNQTTLEYRRNLHTFISTAYYCFSQEKLYSVCYQTDALTDDELEHFLSDMKKLIRESSFDGVMNYVCYEKEYWELSDGVSVIYICLYKNDNKINIKNNYLDD